MMMNLKFVVRLGFGLVAVFLVLGCETTSPTTLRLEGLGTVSFDKPVWENETVADPDGSLSPDFRDGLPTLTGGGALPVLLGAAMDAGVARYQQKKFNKRYADAWQEVAALMPDDIADQLALSGRAALRKHPTIGAVYSLAGDSQFKSEIIAFGLRRFDDGNGEIYLKMGLQVRVRMIDPSGKVVVKEDVWARSADAYTMDELAASPQLLSELYGQSIESFEFEFGQVLERFVP